MPSQKKSIKAVFPLPQGNATVILEPEIDEKGALILNSSGNKFGDAGFYFLLRDSNKKFWVKYLPSFKDQLSVSQTQEGVFAQQKMTLWNLKVLEFTYEIKKAKP